jgi:hypothetical protein
LQKLFPNLRRRQSQVASANAHRIRLEKVLPAVKQMD